MGLHRIPNGKGRYERTERTSLQKLRGKFRSNPAPGGLYRRGWTSASRDATLGWRVYSSLFPAQGLDVAVARDMPLTIHENRFLAELAYNRGDVVLRNMPEVVGIESTNHCNIKCIMCPRGEPDLMQRPVGHMPTSLLERIIDQAEFFTEPAWLHWFGEPLMNPFLFEQIEIAKRKVPNLGISTNATLLRPRAQANLLQSKLDTIIIAIDGATKEIYEAVRKSERFTYEQVKENAEQFLSRRRDLGLKRPFVILSIIVMDLTAPDLNDFRDYWLARGADQVVFKPYVNWGGQYSDVFKDLEVVEKRALLDSPRPHACKLMWESMLVTWDGRVVPCCYDYDAKMVLGDLKTQTLAEVWNGPAYVALRQAELEGRNHSELCASCSQAPGHARDPHWPAGPGRVNMAPEFGWAAIEPRKPAALEVGTTIFAQTRGMHPPENFQGRPLRWTDGAATISIPLLGKSPPKNLFVKLWNLTQSPDPVTIRVNGSQLFHGTLPAKGLDVTLPLPPIDSNAEAVINIDSQYVYAAGDPRALGVAVESLLLLS
jgi:radical SAM protein with 4Fe4S-binding SPASM domain